MSVANPKIPDTPFVNEMRLSARHWALIASLVLLVVVFIPWLWKRVEHFETGLDYRIPYTLSKDYWLYERRLQRLGATNIVLLGDSVVWGEYVQYDGSLSHFLNEQTKQPGRFVNAGVNGLFPLALEGLIRYYGGSLQHRKVILQCNLLWLTSPKADLQITKEEKFNHSRLVPQFSPVIPCYKADFNEKFSAVIERESTFVAWANHLQITYFDQKNIPAWTLEDDGGAPPRYINAYKNPLSQITLTVPPPPPTDPDRGLQSPRHKAWSETGKGSTHFDWVELDTSLQWAAFRRLIDLLAQRHNEVLIVLGPFNEHIMAEENQIAYRRVRDGVKSWLEGHHIAHVIPETLPSPSYADASHPLTQGYQQLAAEIQGAKEFQKWIVPIDNP